MTTVEEPDGSPGTRCVILLDEGLPPGRAANAAAVIALTIGKRHPELAGPDLVDGSGCRHPGLIPIGIAVLGAAQGELVAARRRALELGIDVIDFPAQGQETNDYVEFGVRVARVPTDALAYVGIGLLGPRKPVGRIVGKYRLLR